MIDLQRSIDRRDFIGTVAAGAAAVGLATIARPFDVKAATPSAPDSSPADFEAWLGKIKGKHKQLFDSPAHRDGLPFAWTRVFLMTNKSIGVPESDVTAVLVLRHDSIPLAMEDRVWAKYKFGEQFKFTDGATKAPSVRNPLYHPKAGELPIPGMAIEDLQASGVLIGVCDMALTFYSGVVGKAMSMDPAEVKKDWVSGVLPGIQIVPSGVLAVNRAQEHGCTYCFAG